MVVPPISHPKCWSFWVGKPMVVGETHHFRKLPYSCQIWEEHLEVGWPVACVYLIFWKFHKRLFSVKKGDEILPSYMGIISNTHEISIPEPYKTTRIQWTGISFFVSWLTWTQGYVWELSTHPHGNYVVPGPSSSQEREEQPSCTALGCKSVTVKCFIWTWAPHDNKKKGASFWENIWIWLYTPKV